MKLVSFWHCVILLLLFSCNKTCLIPPQEQQIVSTNTIDPSNNYLSPDTIAIDTLVPDNAVSVKKYGALGNGITDDSNALQAALNTESTLTIPKGIYIINKTLNIKAGTKIYGAVGAVIKTGLAMKTTLQTLGRYFYISNADNCLINNLKFQQSTQPFKFAKWGSACIYIENSANTHITYNFFDFNLPFSNTGFVGIWVSGRASQNTLIKGNTLISAGIEYAESGAGKTIVDGNHITNSPANGLVAHGNSEDYCSNNVVVNNVIENAGYMGIEDWGKVDGSVIRNNKITGTGKNPLNRDGIGISAVGVNSRVVGNIITDAQAYYIEVAGSHNNTIDSNVINDTKKLASGIFINFTDTQPVQSKNNIAYILNNTINGCASAIEVYGDNTPNTNIANNVINDPLAEGVSIDSASPSTYSINVSDNTIRFNVPNKKNRKAMVLYSSLAHGTGNQNIALTNNDITYATTANGGPGIEFGIEVGIDNTVLHSNKINGNNIKGGKVPVKAITSNGEPVQDVTFINNVVTGAVTDIVNFAIKTQTGNSF